MSDTEDKIIDATKPLVNTKQIYTLKLTRIDIDTLLYLLSNEVSKRESNGQRTGISRNLIDRLYRSMGVRL